MIFHYGAEGTGKHLTNVEVKRKGRIEKIREMRLSG